MTEANADLTCIFESFTSSLTQGIMFVMIICSRPSAGKLFEKSVKREISLMIDTLPCYIRSRIRYTNI